MRKPTLTLTTENQEWYRRLIENNPEEARQRAFSLLNSARRDENGCLVSDTQRPRKLRLNGGQDRAYRFVFYVLNERVPSDEEVVRHLCHNPLCMNPKHLTTGDRGDNLNDDRLRRAYGVDFDWI